MATPRIQSVDRAFSILNCLANAGGCESLPTMAARCGLSVATAHRLLTTLESLGAVIHTAPGKYRLGMELLRMASGESREALIAAAAQPILIRISKSLCPTAHLGVLDQDFMVTYLAKATRRSHCPQTRTGTKLEAYCSGLGKVLLATLPADQLQAYLAEGPFIPLTARTITTGEGLADELRKVASLGYAVDDCELFEDLRCVAVPIFDQHGLVVASLSASSPASQLPRTRVEDVARELAFHAREIRAKLYPSCAAITRLN